MADDDDHDEATEPEFTLISGREGFREALLTLIGEAQICLLYTSPSPRDLSTSRMPSSA